MRKTVLFLHRLYAILDCATFAISRLYRFLANFLPFIMAPKRKADSSDGSAPKKRKAIFMEVKVDIIKRWEQGETPTNIGRLLGLSRTTVSTIIGDKKRILEHVKGSAPMKSTVITKQRSGLIIEMERLLVLWLQDQHRRRIPVSFTLIQEKAKRLFESLKREKGEGSENEVFAASRGWFMRFKARANLNNLMEVERPAAYTVPSTISYDTSKESRQRSQQANTSSISAALRKPVNRRPYTSQQESTYFEDDIGQSLKKAKKEFNSNSDVLEEDSSIAQSQLLNSAKPAEYSFKPFSAQPPFTALNTNLPVSHAVPNKQRCILIVSNHQQSVMTSLSSLWKAGKLCDAIISNGTENIKIHKMVLSAVCPKMLNIFDSVPQNNLPKVTFPTTSKEALMAFTEYLYNGILDLDAKILEQLKTIAQCLDMNDFERLCDDQLRIASINNNNSKLELAPVNVKQEVCSNIEDLNDGGGGGGIEEHCTNTEEENKIQIKIEQDDPAEQNYANETFHFGTNNDHFSQDFSSHDRNFSFGPTSDIQQNVPSSCQALSFSSKQSSTPLSTSYQNVHEPVTRPVGYITPTSEQKLITKEMFYWKFRTLKMELTYVGSEKGKKKLCLDGYRYIKDKTVNNKIYWKCEMSKQLKCTARVVTVDESIQKRSGNHNHASNGAKIHAARIRKKVKDHAINSRNTPHYIVSGGAVAVKLPSVANMKRTIRNIRAKKNDGPVGAYRC